MNKYIVDEKRKQFNDATSKPKDDINKILVDDGFELVQIQKVHPAKLNGKILVNTRINHAVKSKVSNNGLAIVHYPNYAGVNFETKLINELKKKNTKIVAFIHDIDSLRFDDGIFANIKEEAQFLNRFDLIISPNRRMTDVLKKNGFNGKYVNLQMFDYLAKKNPNVNGTKYKNKVTFAGNLTKSTFIKDFAVDSDIDVEIFGNTTDNQKINSTLHYNGSVSPEKLAEKMGQGFGLVWDGDKTNTIDSRLGQYLMFNNPYKASSYLSSGMPIIVWDKSAVSEFVNENNVGFSIANLNEISGKINSMSDQEFDNMCNNAAEISDKIRNGYYTSQAMAEAENILSK